MIATLKMRTDSFPFVGCKRPKKMVFWKGRRIEFESWIEGGWMYQTVVLDYAPKADEMARNVEEKANEMWENGYELVTMSVTGSAKAILVFKKR